MSFKLIEQNKNLNKIIYVYPFNTLIEQNVSTLNGIFGDNENILSQIQVFNSITNPKKTVKKTLNNQGDDSLFIDYKETLLNRQFLNSPIVLTTNISLFSFLFGVKKENSFPLHQLANSVIVLDEIQSYKNDVWAEIITFLNSYSKILNIKFIIMSATLPNLQQISLNKDNSTSLINNREKYFSNKIFKNRVNLNFELLDIEQCEYDILINHINKQEKSKILVEFIKKSSAQEFYNALFNNTDREVYLITGDDNIADRNKIINKVKETDNLILVATQVIEAGVDIDMDIGYKDISLLDAEEQFLGRVNRSCKKKDCYVYFFDKDEASYIYKNDYRKQKDLTLKVMDNQQYLSNKDFPNYYNKVLNKVEKGVGTKVEDFFNGSVFSLDFMAIEEHMELINKYEQLDIFINRTLDDGTIGEDIWNTYKSLLLDNNMEYSEKTVKLLEVKSKMNNFIYSVNKHSDISYSDRIGDLFYIEDDENYFTNGKFDRSKLEGYGAEII